MYIAVIALTMVLLPALSIALDRYVHPGLSVAEAGRWLVFWIVGIRLALAGLRQVAQPEFTAHQIFHMTGDEALPVVRELGIANLASATIGLIAIAAPGFVVPAAVYGVIFYGVAGVRHAMERDRSTNENIAMVSDLFAAVVLFAWLWAVR